MWYTGVVTTVDDRKQASVACVTCTSYLVFFFWALPSGFPDRLLNAYRLKGILYALLWQGFMEESNLESQRNDLITLTLENQLLKSDIPLPQ